MGFPWSEKSGQPQRHKGQKKQDVKEKARKELERRISSLCKTTFYSDLFLLFSP
jgi:hypothetical protein